MVCGETTSGRLRGDVEVAVALALRSPITLLDELDRIEEAPKRIFPEELLTEAREELDFGLVPVPSPLSTWIPRRGAIGDEDFGSRDLDDCGFGWGRMLLARLSLNSRGPRAL